MTSDLGARSVVFFFQGSIIVIYSIVNKVPLYDTSGCIIRATKERVLCASENHKVVLFYYAISNFTARGTLLPEIIIFWLLHFIYIFELRFFSGVI